MAKVVIAGEATVVVSSMKKEDIEKIAKYRPDALILKGGEDGKEPIFRVGVTSSGMGSINTYGASFAGEARDGSGLAIITLIGVEGEDIREAVSEKIGPAILNLNKLEEKLPDVLAEIDAEKAEIQANIVVVQ